MAYNFTHVLPDKLNSYDEPPVLSLGERFHTVVGQVGQGKVCEHLDTSKVTRTGYARTNLFHPGSLHIAGHLPAQGYRGGVHESGLHGEAFEQVALLSDVAAALLEEPHGHGHPVEQDLTPRGTLGSSGDHLEEGK